MRFTRWDQVASTGSSNEVLLLLSRWHLSQCGTDKRVEEVRRLIDGQDFSGLCHYELCYDGLAVPEAAHLRQVLAFFQKREDLDLGIDRKAVAWKKFVEAESLCLETNELFRKYSQGGFYFLPDVEAVLYRAQRKISTVLGQLPSLEDLKLRFGPGATTQVKKKDASARRKLSQMFASSVEVSSLLGDILAEMPLWSGCPADDRALPVTVLLTEGRVDFVRKTAKTDRTIGVEPMLNSMVQLGIGSYIARRLAREGIRIDDQTRNQRMAREGSLTGALATLDLSSASDTVSCGLVESLFPYEWWVFLRSVRTGGVSTPHGVVSFQKFSSMGNGFTFPLETLIFYSIAHACCDSKDFQKVSVYGDDIICPTYAVPLLIRTLTACGFIVNKEKSFWEGEFRESCGADYLSGTDIRPCYIKGALSGQICFVLHNHYVRTGQPEPAALVLESIDESLKIWGPDGFGDGHLLGDWIRTPHRREDGWGGFTFETFTFEPRRALYALGADHVYPSYSIYMKDEAALNEQSPLLRQPDPQGLIDRIHSCLKQSGSMRPERSDSTYKYRKDKKRWFLQDTLPGYSGYKRIKVYVHR